VTGVEQLAAFVNGRPSQARRAARVLDVVSCALGALGTPPVQAIRAEVDELGGNVSSRVTERPHRQRERPPLEIRRRARANPWWSIPTPTECSILSGAEVARSAAWSRAVNRLIDVSSGFFGLDSGLVVL